MMLIGHVARLLFGNVVVKNMSKAIIFVYKYFVFQKV